MKTIKITNADYSQLAREIKKEIDNIDVVGYCERVSGTISILGSILDYSLMLHYGTVGRPEAMNRLELLDIQPIWVECRSYDEDDNEIYNDFDFNDLKKHLL